MAEHAAVPAPSALSDTCLKIVKTLHGFQQWMKPAPSSMTSLANECLGLHETLTQGRDDKYAAQKNQPQLVKTMEAFLLGCSMTVSVIETLASNEDDELHEHEQPSKLRTPKTTPSPALSVDMEEIDDDEMYGPMLADVSQMQIRNSEIGIALTDKSSNMKATVVSGAEIVAISTPSQLATDTIEAAAPISKVGPVVVYTIAIAGSEDSGKTEPMNWFLHHGLEQEVPRMQENGRLCKIDDANVVVDIIDDTGQELYRSMGYNYLSRAEGYLFFYKASSHASFEKAQQIQLVVSRPIQERVRDNVPKQPTVLVAFNVESEVERQMSHPEGQSLADVSGSTFVETSGKDDSSFEEATYDMIHLIHQQYTQSTPYYDLYELSHIHPAVAKMIQAHAFFEREERHLARKMLRDIWTRRRG